MSIADRSQAKSRRAALVSGLLAAFVTSSVVSWLTPDGKLAEVTGKDQITMFQLTSLVSKHLS